MISYRLQHIVRVIGGDPHEVAIHYERITRPFPWLKEVTEQLIVRGSSTVFRSYPHGFLIGAPMNGLFVAWYQAWKWDKKFDCGKETDDFTIKDILLDWLKMKGYDGLYGEGCGCFLDDLMPCGEPYECRPGFKCEMEEFDGQIVPAIGPRKEETSKERKK